MKTKIWCACSLLSLFILPFASSANELILASEASKGGSQLVSLDLLSDGEAAGIEVRINVGAEKGARVNTSSCATNVPKSHVASCVYNGKEVVVLIYSMKNESLPAGMIDLGTLSVDGNARANMKRTSAPKPVVTSFIAAAEGGKQLKAKVHTAQ